MMDRPRIHVDFNEMLEDNLVLLSASDQEMDSSGELVDLYEGMIVHVYDNDVDGCGNRDNLLATGIVESNTRQNWSKNARWCCRINEDGIYHESDV